MIFVNRSCTFRTCMKKTRFISFTPASLHNWYPFHGLVTLTTMVAAYEAVTAKTILLQVVHVIHRHTT